MSEKEISLFIETSREWLKQQRAGRLAEPQQPYVVEGQHVIVGPEKPLEQDRFEPTEQSDAVDQLPLVLTTSNSPVGR